MSSPRSPKLTQASFRTSPGRKQTITIHGREELSSMPAPSKKGSSPIDWVWDKIKNNERAHLAWCVTGVVGCLMIYGVLQVRSAAATVLVAVLCLLHHRS